MKIFVVFDDNDSFVGVTNSERKACKLEQAYGGYYLVYQKEVEEDFEFVWNSADDEDEEEED